MGKQRKCSFCDDGKWVEETTKQCKKCDGKGFFYTGTETQLDEFSDSELEDMGLLKECRFCSGTGEIPVQTFFNCPRCKGTGFVND